MNQQEIFDKVADHLLTQQAKSEGGLICRYRDTKHNRACAIGCLIPDRLYSPGLEQCRVDDPRVLAVLPFRITHKPTLDLLIRLQRLHDFSPVSDWWEGLQVVAKDYSLSESVLTLR